MCNPRRIRVRATRELAETWAHEVRRQVTRTGQVGGQAQVTESLAGTIGGPTIGALTNVLAQLDGWTEFPDGTFRHELDGGEISFDPATLELVITATVSAEVSVTEAAAQLVEAQVSGPVEAEGEGVLRTTLSKSLVHDSPKVNGARNDAMIAKMIPIATANQPPPES